jgi:diguanylate cyclase (GGDEF)-like protein
MKPVAFLDLPPVAIVYVAGVSVAGIVVVAQAVPGVGGSHPILIALLLCLSLVASMTKITIPVPGSDASLTVCHVVDFTTLLVCGPAAAVIVASWSAWTQCTFRTTAKNPLHQVVFSVASLSLTMRAAGWVYEWLGGEAGSWSAMPPFEPFLAAGTVVFLVNTVLVASAVALSTRRSIPLVWFESFLSSWPSYIIGAGVAAGIAIVLERGAYWLLPLLAGPLVLLHRNFVAYLEKVQHSVTDPLTGLPNQRYMVEHLEREILAARRTGKSLAVIFIDLDGLKTLNDRGGHATGDAALTRVADRLKGTIRSHDMCARCGGDEFVVVLADCGLSEADERREELQSVVRSIVVDLEPGLRMSLSISAGAAVFPDDGGTQEQLLAVADSRMYQAKFRAARRRKFSA